MIKVVIINGLATVGKSTFCKDCEVFCNDNTLDTVAYELSTVDFVKKIAKEIGWNGVKDERGRQFLHELKMAMTRYDDIPNKKVVERMQEIIDHNPTFNHIFFINARESKDIKALRSYIQTNYMWDVKTLLLKNDNMPVKEVPELVEDIFNLDYDYTIYNTGSLNELYKKAGDFILNLIKN